ARKFFGEPQAPVLDYTTEQLDELAAKVIQDQTSLTGVQPKLSLHLQKHQGCSRLTIVGLWGGYICKPQTSQYPQMPEVEDLTMHLAEAAKIEVVPHTLMRMADDSLCYLTRRIDRVGEEKIAMEDMCQLTERMTENKYMSSYERVGKTIASFSTTPKMDVVNFFELVLFCWLTGNNDMHLKNFSLYEPHDSEIRLTPAYDLLNAAIINPKDDEELALTLNGRKKHINRNDFIKAAGTLGIDSNVVERLFAKYQRLKPKFETIIDVSFLGQELKDSYKTLLDNRLKRLK
ncbi:HipA domain-containing protein, partial [uncultured Duncaniella sp.]|uniref:HipA domain-containing protein n=1 Tax=uncultured Duncaniella sp. TaxID=2768039 RepID=UPI00272C064F